MPYGACPALHGVNPNLRKYSPFGLFVSIKTHYEHFSSVQYFFILTFLTVSEKNKTCFMDHDFDSLA